MSELLLINPGRKVKRKAKKRHYPHHLKKYMFKSKRKGNPTMAKKHKKHRSKAQKAATRKMLRARYGKAVARRAHVNPIHKKRHHRRYRRNPIGGKFNIKSFTNQTLMPATVGAVGALGLDVVLGYLPLPPMLQTGVMKSVTRIAGAVGLGMIAGAVSNRRVGEQVAAGAITVTLYDLIKGWAQTAMPNLPLSGTEEYPVLSYAGAGETVGMYVGEEQNIGMYVEQ